MSFNGTTDANQTRPATEGEQAVAQDPPQQPPAAVEGARALSPDRAGGTETCTTTSSLVETQLQNNKRAEDCSSEELMQRRPQSKIAKSEVAAQPMEVESREEVLQKNTCIVHRQAAVRQGKTK